MCNYHMVGSCIFVTSHLLSLYVCACLLEGWCLKHTFNLIKGKILTSLSKSKPVVGEFSTFVCCMNKESLNCRQILLKRTEKIAKEARDFQHANLETCS